VKYPSYVFWLEALGLMSFGVSWLAASRVLPVVTNELERVRLGKGAIEDVEGAGVSAADITSR
jgi:hypothetical protein